MPEDIIPYVRLIDKNGRTIDLRPLNEWPSAIEDVWANRPSPGVKGRMFFATDKEILYYDTGVEWKEIYAIIPYTRDLHIRKEIPALRLEGLETGGADLSIRENVGKIEVYDNPAAAVIFADLVGHDHTGGVAGVQIDHANLIGVLADQHHDSLSTGYDINPNTINLADLTTDPALAAGLLWHRSDLGRLRWSTDGVAIEDLCHASELDTHKTTIPIDHADGSITSPKLAFATWEKVAEVTTTATVTTISLTGLDLDAAKVYMMIIRLANPTGGAVGYRCYYNGDTTDANYYNQNFVISGTTISAGRVNDATIMYISAGQEATVVSYIQRDPAGYVRNLAIGMRSDPASVNTNQRHQTWVTTANVTRIDISSVPADGIGAGSRVILFKVSG